ncbi:hypothetical protein [Neobacillus sp. LXY-4]
MKKNEPTFSKDQKDQFHHYLEEEITRISVEEEEERTKQELKSDHQSLE